jgi:hypothetical protein
VRTDQRARHAVLESLLGRTPLPGSGQPLLFPDLPDIAQRRRIVLVEPSDADLHTPPPPDERVTVTSDRDAAEPGTVLLEFLRPEAFLDRVGVRLRVSVVDDQRRPQPLGEVVATFVQDDSGALVATEPTHVLAY